MFGDHDAIATIAVKKLDAARKFYEGILGLKPIHEEGKEAVAYKTGKSSLLVYQSQYAGTNKATAASWAAGGELKEIVKTLKSKGVSFEHYDFPGTVMDGDIHVLGKTKNVWFKDPDGNILSIFSQ
jgi:catechol 2,3-dioxygenase-like lactoylglutathione lyase family enzyme